MKRFVTEDSFWELFPRRVVWRRGRPGHEARRGGRYRGVACPRSSTQHKKREAAALRAVAFHVTS